MAGHVAGLPAVSGRWAFVVAVCQVLFRRCLLEALPSAVPAACFGRPGAPELDEQRHTYSNNSKF